MAVLQLKVSMTIETAGTDTMLCRGLCLVKVTHMGCNITVDVLRRLFLVRVLILRLLDIIGHVEHRLLACHKVGGLLLTFIGVHHFHHVLLVMIELLGCRLLLRLLLLDKLLLLLLLLAM